MISERAKHSLDQWVRDSLQAALSNSDDTVSSLDTVATLDDLRATHVVMLSVASYRFRLMLLIYFSHDEATRSHFARSKQIAAIRTDGPSPRGRHL